MKTLHAVLIGEWYDMIDEGIKDEEYRAFNPYWCNRLVEKIDMIYWNGIFEHNSLDDLLGRGKFGKNNFLSEYGYIHYDDICFHRGYTNITQIYEYKELTLGIGKPIWGAPKEEVFIIKLGNRLK